MFPRRCNSVATRILVAQVQTSRLSRCNFSAFARNDRILNQQPLADTEFQKVRSNRRGHEDNTNQNNLLFQQWANAVVLGLAVRQSTVGYALLRFCDLHPLQFGLIDTRGAEEVEQKATEIAAELRSLKNGARSKLKQVSSPDPAGQQGSLYDLLDAGFDLDSPNEGHRNISDDLGPHSPKAKPAHTAPNRTLCWTVGVEDAGARRRNSALLQGLVLGDCKRLFKVAPIRALAAETRRLAGVRGGDLQARQELYEKAKASVADFPEVMNKRGDRFSPDSWLMSDAWASARYAQRATLLVDLRADAELMEDVSRVVHANKQVQRMSEAVSKLYPRQTGRELQDALDTKVNRMTTGFLHRLLDAESNNSEGDGIHRQLLRSLRRHRCRQEELAQT